MVVLDRCTRWIAARLSSPRHGPALGLAVLLALSGGVQGRETPTPPMAVVELQSLPTEARQTHRLIQRGGPFRYAKDGSVFGNRERLLPSAQRRFYREYTVPTPGSPDRGARRIVCGGQAPQRPEVCYYTQDHYASFRRIAP